jgi:hypothetical protein
MKTFKQLKVGQYNFHGFDVIISKGITSEIDIKKVFFEFSKIIPHFYFNNLDAIYIGDFKPLRDRNINAMYENGVFYISNTQDNGQDLLDDLIHETAHLVEDQLNNDIYGDDNIEREFISKRKKLFEMIESETGEITELSYNNFLNIHFDRQFDDYLFNIITYPVLASLTVNIFYSPYASTSIREYYANGFEAYYHKKDFNRLKNISPMLYYKIVQMEKIYETKY